MLKGKIPYILLALLVLGIAIIELTKPKPVNWKETYSKNDKTPFGCYFLNENLNAFFPADEIYTNTTSFYNTDLYEKENVNYLIVNRSLNGNFQENVPEMDIESFYKLINFVENGNNVFLASSIFTKKITDTLNLKTDFIGSINFLDTNSDSLQFAFNDEKIKINNSYFVYAFGTNDTTTLEENNFQQLAFYDEKAILLKKQFGTGNLYLCSAPKLFSNYFILKEDSNLIDIEHYNVTATMLSFLPAQTTYWDEYYKIPLVPTFKSPLNYVLSQKGLKWALYLSCLTLLIYAIFAGKRVQSVIPIFKKEKNLSLEYAKTIAMLYFNKNNNADLAKKKATYFKEKIRNRFYLNTNELDLKFTENLSRKSRVEFEDTKQLVLILNNIDKKEIISNEELIYFNKRMERFLQKANMN